MKHRMYRLMAVVFSCLMIAGAFAGCATAQPTATPAPVQTATPVATVAATEQATEQATSTPTATAPEVVGWKSDISPITLTAYVDFPQDTFNGWGKDVVSAEITKRTGVTIDLKTATTSDSQELNTMLATGDLPDIVIISLGGPMRQLLWKQDFVQPLNKLMDQYCPEMHKILPKDEEKIYNESDGNLYYLTDYYSDVDRIASMPTILVGGVFSLNEPAYKELGSPDISTLDNYKKVLVDAKAKFPDMSYLVYDQFSNAPRDRSNLAQIVNRLYGGGAVKAIGSDGTIHVNFRDESYLNALKYINGLYRDGLFNKENFTITNSDQFKELVLNKKIFSCWGQAFNIYHFDSTATGTYAPYDVPKVDGITPKFENYNTGIGGWHGVSISKVSKNSERAIKYLEFMESDEGQMLMNYGIEGTHYTMEQNMPKRTADIRAQANADWSKFTKTTGIYNYNIQWLASQYTDCMEYFWAAQDNRMYKIEMDVYSKYANNERINGLIMVPSDSDEKVIETKIDQLWTSFLPKWYLASSQDECVAAYNDFITQAESLGLAKLEAAYTKNYQEWLAKLK